MTTGLQHRTLAVSAVHVARPQDAALDIAKLVEHEQRVIAGAAKVAIVGTAFLVAVGRALARIHVEHDGLRGAAGYAPCRSNAVKISESSKVLATAQPLRLE